MKKTRLTAFVMAAVLAFTPAMPVLADDTTAAVTETTEKDHWEKPYYIKNGKKVNGLQKINNKLYYFKNHKLVTYKRAYKINNSYYNINTKGVATKLTGMEKLAAERLNLIKANLNTVNSNTKLAALKKAFLWSANLRFANLPAKYTGSKAAKYYGRYGFNRLSGDCNVMAYTFYWMAKVLGYDAKVVQGYVPTAAVKGVPTQFRGHAWVEIKIGKKTYVYDPNFNSSSDASAQRATNTYVGFKFKYGTKGTYWYHDSKKQSLVKR